MKRTAIRSRQSPKLTVSWREAEFAARRLNAADTCDNRVSDDIYDIEDERVEVEMIAHGMLHDIS